MTDAPKHPVMQTDNLVTLSRGTLKAGVIAERGSVASFSIGGLDVLRPTSAEAIRKDILNAACYPCVPYFGRMSNAFGWHKETYALSPTHPDIGVIHGEGWRRPWEITDKTEESLKLRLEYQPDEQGSWPFAFSATLAFWLSENCLSIKLDVTNAEDFDAPMGAALHPFFPRPRQTRLSFSSEKLWVPSMEQPFKDGQYIDLMSDPPTRTPFLLPTTEQDCTYVGTKGSVEIDAVYYKIQLATNVSNLHLYAPADNPFFCLEPTTMLPGQLMTDRSNIVKPGESKSVSLRIGLMEA